MQFNVAKYLCVRSGRLLGVKLLIALRLNGPHYVFVRHFNILAQHLMWIGSWRSPWSLRIIIGHFSYKVGSGFGIIAFSVVFLYHLLNVFCLPILLYGLKVCPFLSRIYTHSIQNGTFCTESLSWGMILTCLMLSAAWVFYQLIMLLT